MTSIERLEEAKAYIANKGEAVQAWISKETGLQMYSISYRVHKDQEFLGKAMGTGSDLLELVDRLRAKERDMIANAGQPKMPSMAVAAPACLPSYTFCNMCATSQVSTHLHCCNCGIKLH